MALKPGKNIRLFKNPVLEMMTYVHPVMPALVWLPVVAFCFYTGIAAGTLTLTTSLALLAAGIFFWTFAEYFLHRFVFHYHAKSAFGQRIFFLMHGIHHDDPEDQRRLLMPPVAGIIIATIFYALFTLTLGSVNVNPFFSGFLVGYLCYDYIHFATHFGRFKSGTFKFLKQYHMKHHFVAPDRMYGVSSPLWDKIFRSE